MKNKDILLDVIGETDESLVPELTAKKKRSGIIKRTVFSGVCAAAIACAFALPKIISPNESVLIGSQHAGDSTIAEKNEGQNSNAQNNHNNSLVNGVHIPAIKMPEDSALEASDMLGLIVYQGHIYTSCESYPEREIASIVGKHLGTAKGNIEEWSAQDEYAVEFASTVYGEVYSVIGYDTDYRICVRTEEEDEENNKTVRIDFFECLNDITLTKGADLFEDRLHIRERTDTFQFQEHNDWDWNGVNIQNANIDAETWENFWTQVDNGEFINTWDPDISSDDSIYDTQNQAHLILKMSDGTTVKLRLIEGGYVGYDDLSWYFVKIPEDVFNAVYDACGGTH